MKTHIIFDFDGTLVDSAPAILMCFERVLQRHGLEACCAIDESLIGPPLRQTLSTLIGAGDLTLLDALSTSFQEIYDAEVCLLTPSYPDCHEALKQLKDRGLQISIATNKRLEPTRKIIAALGWEGFFNDVLTIDSCPGFYKDKAGMISVILNRQAIPHHQAVYIGDTPQDGIAASANSVEFWPVSWGYGYFGQQEKPLLSVWDLLRRVDQGSVDG